MMVPAEFAHGAVRDSRGEGSSTVLSRVVGEVADIIITTRDVKISYAVEQAFKRKKAFEPVEESSSKFPALVNEALLEWMLYAEAEAIKSEEATPAEKQRLEQDLNGLIRGSEAAAEWWKRLEVTAEEKRRFLDRKIRSKKLIQFRTQSSYVTVTDRDAQAYYQQNKLKFGSTPFEKLKDNIRSFLEQQNAEARLKDWLTILQKKYNVKHFASKIP
jgi:hypothetical protein